jgi:hypothetical protein
LLLWFAGYQALAVGCIEALERTIINRLGSNLRVVGPISAGMIRMSFKHVGMDLRVNPQCAPNLSLLPSPFSSTMIPWIDRWRGK